MARLVAAIGYNLGALVRFSGRQGRALFWPYAIAVFGLSMIALAVVFVPIFAEAMSRMTAYAAAHPDRATITAGPGSFSISIRDPVPGLMPDLGTYALACMVTAAVAALLLAAAVARRLHDRGWRGFWGAVPLPFLYICAWKMPRLFEFGPHGPPPDFGLFAISDLLYLTSLAGLVALLALPGNAAANHFGPSPDDAPSLT